MKILILKCFVLYIALISVISIIVCVVDKHNARKHKKRVKENTLMILAELGGGVAMYFAMRIIHHKTHNNKFMMGIPAIVFIEMIVLFIIIFIIF